MATKKKPAPKPSAKKATPSKKVAVVPVAKKTTSKAKPARPAAKPAVAPAAKKAVVAAKVAAPAKKPAAKPKVTVVPAAKKATAVAKAAVPAKKPAAKPAEVKQVKPVKATKGAEVKPAKAVKAAETPKNKKTAASAGKTVDKPRVILKSLPKKQEVRPPAPKQVVAPPPFKKTAPREEPLARTGKVVIPEIKTKTVRKYEPDFTKSVLDTPMQEQSGPSQRYSDVDLSEFRDLINKKLDSAKKELAYLQGLITRKDEMGGDNDDARYMTMEDGSMSMEREQLSQMASRQITFIDHLEKAIMRIENKTYGICRVTGKLIDKARLRAVPHATLSIEAKQMQHK